MLQIGMTPVTSKRGAGRQYPRSDYEFMPTVTETKYGAWTDLPFSYGPEPEDIKRRGAHNLCVNYNRFKSRENGATAEVSPSYYRLPSPRVLTYISLGSCRYPCRPRKRNVFGLMSVLLFHSTYEGFSDEVSCWDTFAPYIFPLRIRPVNSTQICVPSSR